MSLDLPGSAVRLSVVVPCYNERDAIVPLVAEIRAVLDQLGQSAEILCVDDASDDDTLDVLAGLQAGERRLVVVRHVRRCGQSAALCTGFRVARGQVIVSMDGDGQADPADLPALVAALEGVDLVCGVRQGRHDDWVKRLSSRVGNGFRRLVTRDPTTDAGCTFRAMRADLVPEIPVFNGVHRWLPALMRLRGLRVIERPVRHRPRLVGVSKYGIRNRAWRGVLDCLAIVWWRLRAVPARRIAFVERPGATRGARLASRSGWGGGGPGAGGTPPWLQAFSADLLGSRTDADVGSLASARTQGVPAS